MTDEQQGFNWKYLFESEKDVENFLSGGTSLWGANQGYENLGRQYYYNYVKSLPENISILEIGFAQGLDRTYLKDNNLLVNRNYYGLDVTESFVKHANNKLGWVNAFKYDGTTIPYEDNFFDNCYTRHTMEHQPHYSKLLKEVFRVTKKEVFINWFIPPSEIEEDVIDFDNVFYHNKYSKPKFLQFIKECGWSIKEEMCFKTSNSTDFIMVLQSEN